MLGRTRYARRSAVDGPPGSRNGYGKPRRLALMSGPIEVRRPRIRGLEERFESRLLPLFQRRTHEVTQRLPELYLHGLSQGDFELALRGLLGDGRPCRPLPSPVCGPRGKSSSRPGSSGVWDDRELGLRLGRRHLRQGRAGEGQRRRCWSSSAPGATAARRSWRCGPGTASPPSRGERCCAICGTVGCRRRGWCWPMAACPSGVPWTRSGPRPRSSVAGITRLSTCSTPCRSACRARPGPC